MKTISFLFSMIILINSANAQVYIPASPYYYYTAPVYVAPPVVITQPVVPLAPVVTVPVAPPVCWWQADPYTLLPELFGYEYYQVCR